MRSCSFGKKRREIASPTQQHFFACFFFFLSEKSFIKIYHRHRFLMVFAIFFSHSASLRLVSAKTNWCYSHSIHCDFEMQLKISLRFAIFASSFRRFILFQSFFIFFSRFHSGRNSHKLDDNGSAHFAIAQRKKKSPLFSLLGVCHSLIALQFYFDDTIGSNKRKFTHRNIFGDVCERFAFFLSSSFSPFKHWWQWHRTASL